MNNVMLDIETMGNTSNAAIIAIGACYFDPATGEIGETFYSKVNLESSVFAGAKMDPSTVLWWLQQNEGARAEFKGNEKEPHINIVLSQFSAFLAQSNNAMVWGNGIAFDNVIVKAAYDNAMLPPPWKFWNERDVRTMVDLGQQLGFDPKRDMPFEGDRHNALADAIHQARYVSAIWQRLIRPLPPQ